MTQELIKEAIELAGGPSVVGKAVGRTRQAVSRWLIDGLPPRHVLTLSRMSGIEEWRLAPDIYPPPEGADIPKQPAACSGGRLQVA